MFSRTNSPFLIDLPKEWVDKVNELLTEAYQNKLTTLKKEFAIYGMVHKGEVLVIASLHEPKNENAFPTTYFVSMDLVDGQDYTKSLDTLVDSIGGFFDVYFANDHWMDYQDDWETEEFKGIKLFFKINRENVQLTIKANHLLNQ